MVLRRLPLKGAHNFRDLGGYPAEGGKATAWKRIYRTDGLFELCDSDIDAILKYSGIKSVIDLRATFEIKARPADFARIEGVRYEHVPLISEDRDMREIEDEWKRLENGYIAVARYGGAQIKTVFDIITDTLPSPVLYHCTAGKDRTGIISCLILSVCGVDDFDIVSDYEVSSTYIKREAAKVVEPGHEPVAAHLASPPRAMRRFIEFIKREHGSVLGFLADCGVGSEKINKLRQLFLFDITAD